jgi:5'-nucleotidase/UDP-sugar diphosphatase
VGEDSFGDASGREKVFSGLNAAATPQVPEPRSDTSATRPDISQTPEIHDKPYEPGKTYSLTILHTNDSHGHYWRDRKGRYGFAAQKTLVDKIKEEVTAQGGDVLLVSGGDINTGSPRSDLLNAEPDFRGMKKMGYDCMALGNHEFDNTRSILKKQQEWAGFPFLAANVYEQDSGRRAFTSTVIKDVGGLKVGIVGLLTEDTPHIAAKANTEGLSFRPVCEEARELVSTLREKVGLVVALTHVGHYGDANHGKRAPGYESIARAVDGIDVIVGGHTQITLNEPDVEGETLIVQAGEWGQHLGRLDLKVKDGEIVDHEYTLIPINAKKKVKDADGNPVLDENGKKIYEFVGEEIQESVSMLDLLRPFYQQGGEELEVVIGSTEEKLYGRPAELKRETNLGRLIAASHRSIAKADVGMIHDGGIRASIARGETTYENLLEVRPFGNTVCSFEMTGPAFTAYIEQLFSQNEIIHFDGVKIKRQGNTVIELQIGGESVALREEDDASGKSYKVALNNYSAEGGSSWPDQSGNPSFIDTGFNDVLAVKTFFEIHPIIKKGEFLPDSVTIVP